MDNDNNAKGKDKRKKKLKDIFKNGYFELGLREIENTISKPVLEKTLFKDKQVELKKEFEEKDYMNKKVYMGHFIDEHYRLNRKYSSKNGSGTIICKSIFAKSITENIKEYNDLSKEAKKLLKI